MKKETEEILRNAGLAESDGNLLGAKDIMRSKADWMSLEVIAKVMKKLALAEFDKRILENA